MATPGYPPMGHMPPMGGAPMGGAPGGPGGPPGPTGPGGHGPTQMGRPPRRGTSKAVPIVVSAGLAVGVFCGLLFGVGKKSEAVAAASGSNDKAGDAAKPDHGSATGSASTHTMHAQTTTAAGSGAGTTDGSGSATGATAGSAVAATGSGSGSGSATPTVTAPRTIKLTVTVKPEGAAESARLIIDGKPVEGMTAELPADKKTVRVEVKANGYRSVDKKIDIAGPKTAIELEMSKRSSSSGGTQVRPPKRPDKPPSNSGGGGLIDI